jgi:glutamate formiminotransferase/formiminotetrahydrofolate cyclodeaminase
MAAFRLPAGTDEERAARAAAIAAATQEATRVPLAVLERTLPVLELARRAAERGNPNARSDAGVAGLAARAAARGAYYNVLINLKSLADRDWVRETLAAADRALAHAERAAAEIEAIVSEELAGALDPVARS